MTRMGLQALGSHENMWTSQEIGVESQGARNVRDFLQWYSRQYVCRSALAPMVFYERVRHVFWWSMQ